MYTYESTIETLALRAATRYLAKQRTPWMMTEEDKMPIPTGCGLFDGKVKCVN